MHIKNFDPYDFSKKEIDGVPIYYKNLPWAPCIHIRVVFNSGSFDDPIGKEGLAHFFEHLIFNGSPTLLDKKSIDEWRKIYTLGTWNAWTSLDETCYWLKCLPEKYETVLLGMKDMIFNSYLRSEDIEHERKVITQEAWNRFKNEKYLKYTKELLGNLFHGHEHERVNTALGWPDTIAKISREDIVSRYKDSYGIGNFFIILTGAVEEKHIQAIKLFLKDLPKANKIIKDYGVLGKPKQKRLVKTADEIGEIKEQVEFSLYRVADKRPYLENEISNLFSGLLRDTLVERLRTEHSLCYGVSTNISKQNTYSQIFVNVKTEEKNIELVEKECWNVLDEIVNRKHINKFVIIKEMYLSRLKSTETLSGDIADEALREISKYEKVIKQSEIIEEAEKVTYEDIIKFAKWAFDPEYVYTEIILPSKK